MNSADQMIEAMFAAMGIRLVDVTPRDSDEHRHGEDPKGPSGEAMPARAEGIAKLSDPTQSDPSS